MINETYRSGSDELEQMAAGLAIEALAFVATDRLLFNRFLRVTGLELENLQRATGEPAFLAGVLDFVLADERIACDLAAHLNIPQVRITAARRVFALIYADSCSS